MDALMRVPIEPGDVIAARYRIERLLAVGGMGAVYVAQHVETEQRVALKVLLAAANASERAMEGFRLEARVFSRIRGDHIVRVLDAGVDADKKLGFIVMELLEGETLGGMVRRLGPIAPATLVPLVLQAASALDAAHAATDGNGQPAPIVHRDLKPDNIFVVAGDAGPQVKLLDFGMAKIASATSTASQEIRGTPQYMAVEQIEGHAVQPQTDVAALGLTVFFCVTGRSYWRSASSKEATTAALLREILAGTATPASERARELGVEGIELTPEFDAWFARATATEPQARFPSAGQAARELARVLGESAATTPATTPVLPPSPPHRARAEAPLPSTGASSVTAPVPSRPTSRLSRLRLAAVFGLALAAVATLLLLRSQSNRPANGGASATVSAAAPPVGVSQEASLAFADARAALRDGDFDRCVRSLRRAVTIAPDLAGAQVWLAAVLVFRFERDTDLAGPRDALAAASLHRDQLEPRERAVFNGLQRMLGAQPPDLGALVAVLRPAVAESPSDAVLRLMLARALQYTARFDDARNEARKLIELDPEFAPAYVVLANIDEVVRDYEGKRHVIDACLERMPLSNVCLLNRIYGMGQSCDEVEANARHMVAVLPSDPVGYAQLARTLVNEHRPEQEVLAVVEQRLARVDEEERRRWGWRIEAATAFEYGHFAKADELAAQATERLASDLEVTPHAYWLRMLIAEEVADTRQAATLVRAMRSRASLWTAGWAAAGGDLLVHALKAGAIDRATFEQERDTFRARLPGVSAGGLRSPESASFKRWLDRSARTAASDEDARAACAEFKEGGYAFLPFLDTDVIDAGAVFVQAREFERAKEALGRSLCDLRPGGRVSFPGVAVRRSLLLGRTLEATGDRSGACAAYGEVIERWGAAPRSITADEARSAVKRLACR